MSVPGRLFRRPKRAHVLTALLLLLLAVLCFAGCAEQEKPWRPGMPLPKEKLRIAVLYLDGAHDAGYSFAHDLGIEAMEKTLELRPEQVIRKTNVNEADVMMIDHAMRESIAAGANVIIATSWGYMDTCEKLAKEYPGVIFAHASGYKSNATNFTNYFGRIYQARYLGGIVAGLSTKSGKIGFVAALGAENSEVTSSVNAFALGVESVNPDARVYVRVTNNWYDPAGESHAAKRLISAGCDVITQYCDTPNPQLEAEKAGVRSIGYNSDMEAQAPDAVLTSVVWHWGVYYTQLVRSVLDGSFTTAPYFGGMAEGFVGLAPLNRKFADQSIETAVTKAAERMVKGDLRVFSGEMKTNTGTIVGATGTTLRDEDITRRMNWYYHTVMEL